MVDYIVGTRGPEEPSRLDNPSAEIAQRRVFAAHPGCRWSYMPREELHRWLHGKRSTHSNR